ncbi:MAG: YitT family protein, partial [Deltaproteobacteria bacterium]|nr:YitT family protein [Deltaproteobacteria bacterium]
RQVGPAFAIRSVAGIVGLAVVLVLVPYPVVTKDLLLIAVFGGFFLGAGIGLAVRGGAVLDGTEIAALLISKRSVLLNVGDVILGFNVLLFSIAIFVIGVEESLYSILTYMTAAKTLDFVLYGLDEFTAITIVSDASAAIRERITGELGRGVTVYRGFGGKSGADKEILYCVVTRLEIGRIKAIVKEVDERAFVVFHPLAGAEGGMIKRTSHHWKTTIKNFR